MLEIQTNFYFLPERFNFICIAIHDSDKLLRSGSMKILCVGFISNTKLKAITKLKSPAIDSG